jgi:hypothetical protein
MHPHFFPFQNDNKGAESMSMLLPSGVRGGDDDDDDDEPDEEHGAVVLRQRKVRRKVFSLFDYFCDYFKS